MELTRLIIGERSNMDPGQGSLTKILHGTTRHRLDWCLPDWEERFVVRNIWGDKLDQRDINARLREIIEEVKPTHIVALGVTVSIALGQPYPQTEWLETTNYNGIEVLKFPHPSGRSRVWNDQVFADRAATALAKAAGADPKKVERKSFVSATEAASPTKSTSGEHVLTELKFWKTEAIYELKCLGCNWAVAGAKKAIVEGEGQFHVEHAKPRKHTTRK